MLLLPNYGIKVNPPPFYSKIKILSMAPVAVNPLSSCSTNVIFFLKKRRPFMMSTSLQSEDSVSQGVSGSKIAALEEKTSAAPPENSLNNVGQSVMLFCGNLTCLT